ncbi:nucleotide disphospho-sugar-binding domain-containing protein [Kutzneria sp. CA-103260]|uniref:nucleotide disphospho-sugar-binding domain-containing protein n=1 Tax=Kutzneria sp. CA-103260 TaxID=2802641 RepID=UPI001BA60CC3|nr:nucleotide disphospho-sugar-binding domain-containing protein [Kutzneria sp. CA-103260]QUQ65456.1 glycosyl transferase family protein [Kutzneria sp. CA-103260]
MRVLFTMPPDLAHMFPLIPLAWATRTCGHEVLIATSEQGADITVKAGLPTAEVSPDVDFPAIFRRFAAVPFFQGRSPEHRELSKQWAETGVTPDPLLQLFAAVSDAMVDGVTRVAEHWRPDLVVYSRLEGAGPLAARKLGVPAVEHDYGFIRNATDSERLLTHLSASYRRNNVPPELPRRTWIHVGPPSMMVDRGPGWAVRYVPYNAGGLLPDWLLQPRKRPRIGVTLGTVVPRTSGVGGLQRCMASATKVDAEFVLLLGADPDTSALGELPDNVRVTGWIPLNSLLAVSDALVHHGGAGTTLTAACAGVPQLVIPHGADHFVNAHVAARRGVGLVCEPTAVTPDVLDTLLNSDQIRAAAAEVRAEIERMPTPAQIVPKLLEFAS